MESAAVLIVSSDVKWRSALPDAFSRRRLQAFVAPRMADAAETLRSTAAPLRAVVCTVDGPEELSAVVRARKARRDVPLLMLTSILDPGFRALGEQLGATRVATKGDPERAVDLVTHLMAVREAREGATRGRALADEIRTLARRNRELLGMALGFLAGTEPGDFRVLLVAGDGPPARRLARQLERAGIPPCVQATPSPEEARAYLEGLGLYARRDRHPLPSLVLCDLHLEGGAAPGFIRGLKEDPRFAGIGVLAFSALGRPEDDETAYAAGADAFVGKPLGDVQLAEIVRFACGHAMAYQAGLRGI